jgi:large subunit ribosomal protein L22
MGRAFRYQRRLTHIVLAVAERAAPKGLVTKVEEPAAKAPKATKAAGTKKEAPKAAAKTAGATKKKAVKKA